MWKFAETRVLQSYRRKFIFGITPKFWNIKNVLRIAGFYKYYAKNA